MKGHEQQKYYFQTGAAPGAIAPPPPYDSFMSMMIIPLPHYDNLGEII